ncbi:MAG: helix-hairpin-helix domain-containing protein, partial [Kiritimatiellaeota bacterium]|nr:helix-hairpin-helix domain-containing protein [Kiritimatiellota bacterium]
LPGLVVLDGGSLQLRAAREALAALGLDIPTIGLAERHEEIIAEPFAPPLLLERDAPPLLLLMRLRDEAHRFALSHHQRLRNRLLTQSILDDVMGVGPAKKELLIKTFGSVRRVAAATREQLAAVPGITPALAEEILRVLAH